MRYRWELSRTKVVAATTFLVTQTVDIPASHRLTIDVPAEVPVGRAVITFTPASPDADNDPLPTGECPICAAHNYMPNAKTIAVIEECRAMARGEIPSTLRSFDTFEEMWEDLDRDDPEDDLDDE